MPDDCGRHDAVLRIENFHFLNLSDATHGDF